MACSTDVQQFSIALPYAARDQKTHSSNKGILILRWHFVHRELQNSSFRVQYSIFISALSSPFLGERFATQLTCAEGLLRHTSLAALLHLSNPTARNAGIFYLQKA
jgi:hypothetical protein